MRSVFGTYLGAKPDGDVNIVANCNEWEEWKIIRSLGKIGFKSRHGTCLRAQDDGSVDLASECKAWELWTVNFISS